MTYEEVLSAMHALPRVHRAPTMQRILYLLSAVGDPHTKLSGRFIHVTGTNGKGSTCAFLSSVLTHAGYRVGRFVSPFIMDFCERMEIDGKQIQRETVAALGSEIFDAVKRMEKETNETLLEFEIVTAMGLLWFARENCDLVVLEVGIGGRDDPTNVVTPLLSVITHVDLDHTELLGDTPAAIAEIKAAIVKEGAPCVLGAENVPEVQAVLQKRCEETHSALVIPDTKAAHITSAKPGALSFTYKEKSYTLSLSGIYQIENALCAIEALTLMPSLGYPIKESDIAEGLRAASLPARFEVLKSAPYVIFDGAHNPSGIASLRRSIETYFDGKQILCLCGMLSDKHPDIALADMLSYPHIAEVACVTPPSPRAMQGEALARVFSENGISASSYPTVAAALKGLLAKQKKTGMPIICFGSLYLAGEIRRFFGRADEKTTAPLGERIAYYKCKWRKEHLPSIILATLVWLWSVIGITALGAKMLAAFLSGALALLIYLLFYNRMMIYVEKNAFDGSGS